MFHWPAGRVYEWLWSCELLLIRVVPRRVKDSPLSGEVEQLNRISDISGVL